MRLFIFVKHPSTRYFGGAAGAIAESEEEAAKLINDYHASTFIFSNGNREKIVQTNVPRSPTGSHFRDTYDLPDRLVNQDFLVLHEAVEVTETTPRFVFLNTHEG